MPRQYVPGTWRCADRRFSDRGRQEREALPNPRRQRIADDAGQRDLSFFEYNRGCAGTRLPRFSAKKARVAEQTAPFGLAVPSLAYRSKAGSYASFGRATGVGHFLLAGTDSADTVVIQDLSNVASYAKRGH